MKITLSPEEITEILAAHLETVLERDFDTATAELEDGDAGVTFAIDAVEPEYIYEDEGDDDPGEAIPILRAANG